MPTYEYVCRACGQDLEVVQAFADASLTTCPTCGGELRKLFGKVGIAFKGSGFYKNDSRAKAKGTTAKSEGATESVSATTTKSDNASPSTPSADKPAAESTKSTDTKSSDSKSAATTSS